MADEPKVIQAVLTVAVELAIRVQLISSQELPPRHSKLAGVQAGCDSVGFQEHSFWEEGPSTSSLWIN